MMDHEPESDADWLLYELGGKHRAQVLSTLAATRLPDRIRARGRATVAELANDLLADLHAGGVAPERGAQQPGVAQIARHQADVESLLRAAAGLGCLREGPPGTFALTARGEQLHSDALGSFAAYLGSKAQWDPWSRFRESLIDPDERTPFARTFGQDLYAYLANDAAAAGEYDAAIDAFTSAEAERMRAQLDWSERRLLVDVGGGRGTLLRELLQDAPRGRGVLLDLPHVVAAVAGSLPDRVEAMAGDFFVEVPNGADVYLVKHVLHNWDDDRAALLLRNCASAMADDGIVVVIDAVLAPDNRPDLARMLDLEMRVLCGGQERRKPHVRRLLASAGLHLQSTVQLTAASCMFVAGKRATES